MLIKLMSAFYPTILWIQITPDAIRQKVDCGDTGALNIQATLSAYPATFSSRIFPVYSDEYPGAVFPPSQHWKRLSFQNGCVWLIT
jgi:hypothetical protein